MYREKREVAAILSLLPLKHPEKQVIKHLILSEKLIKRKKVELYKKHRDYIRRQVKAHLNQAETE